MRMTAAFSYGGVILKRLILLSSVFCMLMSSCSSKLPSPAVPETTVTPLTTAASEALPVYDDSLISDILIEDTYVFQDDSSSLSYEYHLPQLKQDSADAKQINADILAAKPEPDEAPFFDRITWESHWNDSLLSLIVRCQYPHSMEADYLVILYDYETQKSISQQELLSRFSLNEDALLEELSFTAVSYFDKMHADLNRDFLHGLQDLRAQTLSRENLLSSPLFVDDTGSLAAIVTIATPAGGGYNKMALQLKTPLKVSKAAADTFASAILKDGTVTVSFHLSEDSRWSLGEEFTPHDTPIPVDRIYGNYVDLGIGNLGSEFWPILVLLDENGQITWCDLQSYDAKTKSFHGIGPVACAAPVTGFSESDRWGFPSICGLDADGNEVDFYDPIYDSGLILSPYLYANVFESADSVYTAAFPKDDPASSFYWAAGGGHVGSGLVFAQGMDSEGIHYSFDLGQLDGPDIYGNITMVFPPMSTGDLPWLVIENSTDNSMPGLAARSQVMMFWGAP